METEITKIWTSTLAMIKQEILATTLITKQTVEESWTAKIICEQDFPCCEYSTEYMANVKLQVIRQRSKMIALYELWYEKEQHRVRLDDMCPDGVTQTCATMGPCWNGQARMDDDSCSCPMFIYPQCPITVCDDDQPMDDDCECPQPVPKPAVIEEPEVIIQEIQDQVAPETEIMEEQPVVVEEPVEIMEEQPVVIEEPAAPEIDYRPSSIVQTTNPAFPTITFPEPFSFDKQVKQICSGNDYCGFRLQMTDGTWSSDRELEDDAESCFEFEYGSGENAVTKMDIMHYGSVGASYDGQLYFSRIWVYLGGSSDYVWSSKSCEYDHDREGAGDVEWVSVEIAADETILGAQYNFLEAEGDHYMYNFRFAVSEPAEL